MNHRQHSKRIALVLLALSPLVPVKGQTVESSFQTLHNDLFDESLFNLRIEHSAADWELKTTLSRSDFDLEFRPASFDFLGAQTRIKEESHSIRFDASRELQETLKLDLGLAYRNGFSNYRAAWLDTYFDQHFAPLEGVPGHELYAPASPSASSANAGLRWEYLPASGIASLSFSRIQDKVSPGYEIDFDGIRRSERILATTSLSVASENVLSPHLRSRIALTATDTSARERRYAAEVALNAAIGERFIWRNKIGASTENPQFDASFIDTAIEFQANDSLSLFLGARHYEDTGEIENALLFTTAAPALDNDSLSLGLRYRTETWNSKLSLTHSHSDFAETNLNTDFFQNLYFDADWLSVQLALGKSF